MKAVFTIEQIDGKLVITIEQAEPILKEQDGIDWSKHQPFPEWYKVPIGVLCVSLSTELWGEYKISKGDNVKVLEESISPFVEALNKSYHRTGYDFKLNGYVDGVITSHNLAPINPTDHPLHPDFKGNK